MTVLKETYKIATDLSFCIHIISTTFSALKLLSVQTAHYT